jgi:hypothetical protein
MFLSLCIAKLSPQLQVKLCLKAELALFLLNPATTTPHHHPHIRPGKFIFQHFSVNVDQVSLQELEDDLNSFSNGRRPQFLTK